MVYDSASRRVGDHLLAKITAGRPGDRLPSVRSLTSDLGVSPSTVRMAVEDLAKKGLLETVSGRGTFIAQPASQAAVVGDYGWQSVALGDIGAVDQDVLAPVQVTPTADTIDFASGYPDSVSQPVNLVAKALRNAARRPEVFDRAPREGLTALRRWFAQQLTPSGQHRVLVCPGGQSALSLAFRSLAQPGEPIAVSSPTYLGAIVAARAARLAPVAIPLDDEGLVIDQLEVAVETTGVRLVYVQPTYHNPTGVVMSSERRKQLLALAERHRLIIIEDDSMASLGPAQHLPSPLAATDPHGHVVHLHSLTKSVSPGLRIAGLSAVGVIAQRLLRLRSAEDFFVSPMLQDVALSVVTDRGWPGHLKALRSEMGDRQRFQLEALQSAADWPKRWSQGPLYLWCDTPKGVTGDEFRNAALRHGVAVVSGSAFFSCESDLTRVRLSVPNAPMAEIATGASRLAEALASLRQSG